jgi:hypothetical protein
MLTNNKDDFNKGVSFGYSLAQQDFNNLLAVAIKTLKDNLHLCDGDTCSLKELCVAVEAHNPNWFE